MAHSVNCQKDDFGGSHQYPQSPTGFGFAIEELAYAKLTPNSSQSTNSSSTAPASQTKINSGSGEHYIRISKGKRQIPLWTTTRGEDTPDSLCYRNLNVSSARQWRSRQAYDICISFKVYKVWEALYTNSNIFRQLIDDQEKDCRNFSRCCMALQPLWLWLKLVVEEGLVERGDVDQLPEPSMLRDVVIGSGDPPDAVDLGLVNPAMCH
ncbi:hypothetical protein TWF679_007845 [Orbilia oligospora]|uniref:Uncharacterized protein n=1 Tax=Orbilia oligospora TaxID=2813651 RepID=A0A8H8V6C2_ORBOL|nr:hypothetical protein TWF679_007845 [Orbilia oligospora]